VSSFKKTLIFAIVVLSIGGLCYFDYTRQKKESLLGENQEMVFKGKEPNALEWVTVESGKRLIRMERVGNRWQIKNPIEEFADSSLATVWLYDITKQKFSLIDGVAGEDYGFEKPLGRVDIQWQKGGRDHVSVGRVTAFGDGYYLKLPDGRLAIGSGEWPELLRKNPNRLRNSSLFPYMDDPVEIISVSITFNNESWSFEKIMKRWQGKNNKGEVNEKRLSAFIDSVGNLRAMNFVIDNPTDLHRDLFLLARPVIVVTLKVKHSGADEKKLEEWRLTVGQEREGYRFALTSDRKVIYRLADEHVEELLNPRSYYYESDDNEEDLLEINDEENTQIKHSDSERGDNEESQ
jgi:hypothetical protein